MYMQYYQKLNMPSLQVSQNPTERYLDFCLGLPMTQNATIRLREVVGRTRWEFRLMCSEFGVRAGGKQMTGTGDGGGLTS